MGQKYKVFTEQSGILIEDSPKDHESLDLPLVFKDFNHFNSFVGSCFIKFCATDAKKKLDSLFLNFERVDAAGGIVTCNHHVLLIFRNGIWDLPKGHVELNEPLDLAALREVREECGLVHKIDFNGLFQNTYHTYEYNQRSMLKVTSWFLMHTEVIEELTPQLEEGITACKWVHIEMLQSYLPEMFLAIRELLIDFIDVQALNK